MRRLSDGRLGDCVVDGIGRSRATSVSGVGGDANGGFKLRVGRANEFRRRSCGEFGCDFNRAVDVNADGAVVDLVKPNRQHFAKSVCAIKSRFCDKYLLQQASINYR